MGIAESGPPYFWAEVSQDKIPNDAKDCADLCDADGGAYRWAQWWAPREGGDPFCNCCSADWDLQSWDGGSIYIKC